MANFTQDELKEVISYNPETGAFAWRVGIGSVVAGKPAGCINTLGYLVIRFKKKLYLAHRLAWFYVNGSWPQCELDHINGNPSDNRMQNLREASHAENNRNKQKHTDNSSGFKGVSLHRQSGLWEARICKDGVATRLGLFRSPENASRAYDAHVSKLHGEFARANGG